jgi:hypothetical protein
MWRGRESGGMRTNYCVLTKRKMGRGNVPTDIPIPTVSATWWCSSGSSVTSSRSFRRGQGNVRELSVGATCNRMQRHFNVSEARHRFTCLRNNKICFVQCYIEWTRRIGAVTGLFGVAVMPWTWSRKCSIRILDWTTTIVTEICHGPFKQMPEYTWIKAMTTYLQILSHLAFINHVTILRHTV